MCSRAFRRKLAATCCARWSSCCARAQDRSSAALRREGRDRSTKESDASLGSGADRGDAVMWVRRAALDAAGAKAAMIAANAGHSGLSDLEETWIVRSLCREHGLTQVEVGKALRRDKSWVSRRLMLAEQLEGALQDDIRLGLLAPTVARVPRGNQVRMAATIFAT